MINLNYKDGRTLHEQIEEGIKDLIINGVLKPEDKLPSVRELSVTLTINPNTVQRAYKQLETDGFIYSVKAKGNFVSHSAETRDKNRIKEIYSQINTLTKELVFMGESREKIIEKIDEIYLEMEDNK